MLGRSIVKRLSTLSNNKLYGVSKTNKLGSEIITEHQVNLADESRVGSLLKEINPDLIIHTAAFTNLQYCESNKREALQLHVNLTLLLSQQAPIIYISTDSVFDGSDGLYDEDSPSYPLNYYAQSKLQGEFAAHCSNSQALVLRTNIYGFKEPPGNSLAEWALHSFQEGKTISGYSDVFFNPLYVGQLADLVAKCAEHQTTGVLHVGTSECVSKFDFLRMLARTLGYSESLVLESTAPLDTTLRRPKNTTLGIQRLKEKLNEEPSLQAGLNMFKLDYLQSYEVNQNRKS